MKVDSRPSEMASVNELERAPPSPDPLLEVGKGFESIFIQKMIEQMRKSSESIAGNGNSVIPKGNGEKIFQGLLDAEYAKVMSEAGGIGIAQMVVESLKK